MLKLKIKEKTSDIIIENYEITYPFSKSVSYNDKNVLWNLNHIECKGIRGNFRLLYARKNDFSGFTTDLEGGAFGAGMVLGMFLPQVLGTVGKILKIKV